MNRERAVEKQLSAPATTEIINDEAVSPESSNEDKHFFWFQLLSELGIFSSAYASRLVFNKHARQAKPCKDKTRVCES